MNLRSDVKILIRLLLITVCLVPLSQASAQQTPLNPLSYWVFTPYLYNPAMVGSKDFVTLDLNGAFQGKSHAEILSGNARLSRTKPGYFSSPQMKEFNSIGIGGSIFNDLNGTSRNTGINAAGAYQIPLNTKELSFLSFGMAVKGIYNRLDTGGTEAGSHTKNTFFPNVDAGIYYYGTNLFAGISAVNILGTPGETDSLGRYGIPVQRQYFLTIGYKLVISKSQNVVLEPSILVEATDSTFSKIAKNISPVLKLYIDNFCLGSYFLNEGNTSFFFQYRYPRLYVGAFYELPRNTAYYKKAPIVEFTLGLNFQTDKSRLSRQSRW